MKKSTFLLIIILLLSRPVTAQDKFSGLQEKLMLLSISDIPALNEQVNISVTNTPIRELLRGLANNTGLNINVSAGLNIEVICNFSNVKAIDILLFLCRQYDLNISVIGNILNVFKEQVEVPVPVKNPLAKFNEVAGLLTIECENENLASVVKEIIDETRVNIVPAPGLEAVKVRAYIQNLPFHIALENFAYGNNLKISKTEDSVYLIEKNEPLQTTVPDLQRSDNLQRRTSTVSNALNLSVVHVNGDTLSVIAENASLADIIKVAASRVDANYFFTSPIEGVTTLNVRSVSFPSLLTSLFYNTTYSYRKKNGVYLIGDNKKKDLTDSRIIQLQNRTVDTLISLIPPELKKDMELKEFPELNSLLVSGIPDRLDALETFVRSVDQLVPVILIEVMIIDAKNIKKVTTGLEAGLGNTPSKTGGVAYPGTDMSFSSQSINNLINSFNGFGSIKIGSVTPNFYFNLKALESSGIINIRSTPRLSTLNGHSAYLSIGNTEYYQEQQNNIYGSFTSQFQTLTIYKDVKAELSVKIRPVVSGDDQITLDIEVRQEDFTSRISQYAPPGKVARTFRSLIRVKDQEMILLGGLEEKRVDNSGSGFPVLSRIPVIKWLFSSRTKNASNSKLNIFIKPTIVD